MRAFVCSWGFSSCYFQCTHDVCWYHVQFPLVGPVISLCLWDESICLFVCFFHVIFSVHMTRVLVSCAVPSSGARDLSGGGAVPAGGSAVCWPAGHGHGCADHVHWDPCLHSGRHVEEETHGLQQPPQWELDPFFSWPTNLTHYRPTGGRIAQL